MEKRIRHLELDWRRPERSAVPAPDEPVDWRAAPWELPACFAAMTEAEKAEWGELMTEFHAPDSWERHKDDRGFFRRLAELDAKMDMHAKEAMP
jgi:hypothetical protein